MGTESLALQLTCTEARQSLRSCGVLTCGFLVFGGGLCATPLPLAAQTFWTGGTSTDWFTPGNWNSNAVPTAVDLVQINTITPRATMIAGGAAVAAGSDIGNFAGSQGAPGRI